MAVFFDQDMSGVVVTFNDGSNSESFTYDTEIGDTGTDVYTFAEAFKSWANHGDRAWSGSRVFSYSFTTFGVNHGLTISVNAGGAFTINSVTTSKLNLPGGTTSIGSSGGSLAGTAGIPTTLSATYAFRKWRAMKGKSGMMSSGGSWQFDPMHARLKTADVFSVIKQADLYALTLATKAATTPRRAVFLDSTRDAYRRVFVSEIVSTIGKRDLHKVEITVTEAA
jgi:hypothetical protein|tara:strand:- start:1205 stop:1876 length:672 start_codon:yes stop_codon:yes gene_type:complete